MNVIKKMKDLVKVPVKAVTEAINIMKTRKAAESSGITSELLKVRKNDSVKKLAEVANNLLQEKTCLRVGEVT